MPQFPMTESRRRVLEKIPDYAVDIAPAGRKVKIAVGDQLVAASDAALLVRETKHADVFYLPKKDVDMSKLEATTHSTYCPFKGHASYWSLRGNSDCENFAWSYEETYPEVEALKGYLSFYPDRVTIDAA